MRSPSSSGNVFSSPRPSPYDTPFIVIFVIMALFVAYATLNDLAYATIYMPLTIFAVVLLIMGVAFKGRYVAAVVFGRIHSERDWPRFAATLASSIGISLLIAFLIYYNVAAWIGLPFAIGTLTTSASVPATLLTYSIFLVFIEVSFFFCTLLPTIVNGIRDTTIIAAISIVGALIFYFFIHSLIAAAAFAALAAVFIGSRLANKEIARHPAVRIAIGVLFCAVVFAGFHYPQYAGLSNALELLGISALVFALIAALCILMENTLPAFVILGSIDCILFIIALHASIFYLLLPLVVFPSLFVAAVLVRKSKTGAVSRDPAGVQYAR